MPPLFTIPGIVSGRALGLLFIIALFVLVIYHLGLKKQLYVRRVPGLDAIEDAIGRATEMRRPVVASYGTGGLTYSTIVGLTILSHVARLCAKTNTRLIVPVGGSDSSFISIPVARDIVKQAFIAEGRPEMYTDDDIPFFSGQQYAYTGGYIGVLQRARPGVLVMTGSHSSETLNIAETGNWVGAIVITAATSMSYAAFLVCASDYCLIGEESPAAGAYLSDDPAQRASIRCQDIFKGVAIALLISGLVLIGMGNTFITNLLLS